MDGPHAATLGGALDAAERAADGEATAAELDELEQRLSHDPAPGKHQHDRGQGNTASGAVDTAHHALWLGDASTGAAQAGKELAEEVRDVARPPSVAQVRAETERKRARS